MQIVGTTQNSEEWYELRKNKLGASDANIIMGKSKFCTIRELWEKKINPKPDTERDSSFIQEKGHKLEIKTRAMIEIEEGIDFPPLTVISEDFPFLMASLDGYSEVSETVLECKYVGQEDFEKVKNGECLMHYYPQIQQQIMLTNARKCILAVCTEDKENGNFKFTKVNVEPDIEYMANELIPAMTKFWSMVESKTPPDYSEKDVISMDDNQEFAALLCNYKELSEKADEINKQVDEIKQQILKMAVHEKVTCHGFKVSTSVSKGKESIDYEAFIKDNNLNIPDTYKKIGKGSKRTVITFPKTSND